MANPTLTIDEYIAAYDGEPNERMAALRALIRSAYPDITKKSHGAFPRLC